MRWPDRLRGLRISAPVQGSGRMTGSRLPRALLRKRPVSDDLSEGSFASDEKPFPFAPFPSRKRVGSSGSSAEPPPGRP